MRSPEGCLSGRTIRGAAAFTLVGEFIEVGDIVQHSTPDFAEPGSHPQCIFSSRGNFCSRAGERTLPIR
jgi:hypothetical protein